MPVLKSKGGERSIEAMSMSNGTGRIWHVRSIEGLTGNEVVDAVLPVALGGGATAGTILAIRGSADLKDPTKRKESASTIKNAPWYGLGVGGAVSLVLGYFGGMGAGVASAVSSLITALSFWMQDEMLRDTNDMRGSHLFSALTAPDSKETSSQASQTSGQTQSGSGSQQGGGQGSGQQGSGQGGSQEGGKGTGSLYVLEPFVGRHRPGSLGGFEGEVVNLRGLNMSAFGTSTVRG